MQSRRDQVQAQSYVLGRLTSALVVGDPEAYENPHRRVVVGTVAGILVALLALAGWTVFGVLRPGSATSWQQPGALIVEKETGTRYVLAGGVLHPVINYTSAVLLFGQRPPVVSVSASSLRSTPRGTAVGIVGAPDALPDPAGLSNVDWEICAGTEYHPDGSSQPATMLALGPAAEPDALGADEALPVRTPSGEAYLLWGGYRYRMMADWIPQVFGLGNPVIVGPGLLDQLPPRADLGPPAVVGRGQPGPVLDGKASQVGQIFVSNVAGTAARYFLLLADGLSPLSQTGLALALGDPATATAYAGASVHPLDLSAAALATATMSRTSALPPAVPATPPHPVGRLEPPRAWCVREAGDGSATRLVVDTVPATAIDPDGMGATRTAATATQVRARAGIGGLARAGRPAQYNGDALFLITDAGVKFPVASDGVAKELGYDPASATVVSPALLTLLPTGPVLDPGHLTG